MSVVIRGVELTNNVEEKRSVVVETILKPLLSKQNSLSRGEMDEMADESNMLGRELAALTNRKLMDFRDKKLPHSLIMFAQVLYKIVHYHLLTLVKIQVFKNIIIKTC